MDDLSTALRALARTAEAPTPGDPAGTWAQGRARVRRRRVGAAAGAAALVAILSASSWVVSAPRAVVPANPPAVPAVPTNVWTPPLWMAWTSDGDPVGQAAVLGGTDTDDGFRHFVVSARTGEYRWLRLPGYGDVIGGNEAALSPDGNRVAYWLAPRVHLKDRISPSAGLAVLDLRTGRVRTWRPPFQHGYLPGMPQSILWLDSRRIFTFGSGADPDPNVGPAQRFVWDITRTNARLAVDQDWLFNSSVRNADGTLLGRIDNRRFGLRRPDGSVDLAPVLTLPKLRGDDFHYSPSRSSEFVVLGRSDGLAVGAIGPTGGVPSLKDVIVAEDFNVLGWLSDSAVLGSVGLEGEGSLYRVDLEKGTSTRLGVASGLEFDPGVQVATDLLDEPMVPGVQPPTRDPRLTRLVVAGSAIVIASVTILLLSRRRRA